MLNQSKEYEVIVVGGGHAGCEAALAAARMGCLTLLLTMNLDTIALMSCNPAIGGLAKGQLVREIDALGGQMAKAIDKTGIQFRQLNTSKGPAVRSSRAQADRQRYRLYMKSILEGQSGLDLKEALVVRILVKDGVALGVETSKKERFFGRTVVISPGTFPNGLIYMGEKSFPAGRMGEPPAAGLSQSLKEWGFDLGRLKTCTPPRLEGNTIDFSKMEVQWGDKFPLPFSFSTTQVTQRQIPCHLTYTNPSTHKVIQKALNDPLFYKVITSGTNPRYCPSIEEKILRFPQRQRHQVFIEPEGLDTEECYANGLFTFLDPEVQVRMLRTICGLEDVKISRPGYGIEYDYVNPTQLCPTLETKAMKNLYLAGQINGTTGYEEAAAQGLMAGINAALRIKGKDPLILDRSQAYIGVLIDDLVTKGTNEPYRMFTSRAEYRLLLREDNADLRLREIGYKIGLVNEEEHKKVILKKRAIEEELNRLKRVKIAPNEKINKRLKGWGTSPLKNPTTLEEFLRRPHISYQQIRSLDQSEKYLSPQESLQVEVEIKYRSFIERQEKEVKGFKKMERIKIPSNLDFQQVPGLSWEVREKLSEFRPISLGQASRISGVTPAAISILMVYLKKRDAAAGQ